MYIKAGGYWSLKREEKCSELGSGGGVFPPTQDVRYYVEFVLSKYDRTTIHLEARYSTNSFFNSSVSHDTTGSEGHTHYNSYYHEPHF